jgi:peptidoglycan/LPS O-acetylase OafA/YrhL
MLASASLCAISVEKRSSIFYLRAVRAGFERGLTVLAVTPGAAPEIPGLTITGFEPAPAGGGWFTEPFPTRADASPAQISLTSGTTGAPKAIQVSHRALHDVTHRLIDVMELDDSVREYVGAPVTFSFGFGRIRAVAAAGGCSFLPERGFRVDEFAAMLRRGEVNALSAVPTMLRLVLAQADLLDDCRRSLRWLEIGSQAISRDEKEALRRLFPAANIIQHYGLTEASRTTFLNVSGAEWAELDSVGRATGQVEVRIAPNGLIQIRGPHVADGVLTQSGLEPLTDADGWLTTQDMGALQGGFLYFAGRADDLINVGGIKVQAEGFEQKLRARLPAGAQIAAAGAPDPLRGEIVVVAHETLETEPLARLKAAAEATASELGIGGGFALLPMPELPRTETNKVRRAAIRDVYVSQVKTEDASASGAAAGSVNDIFVATFGAAAQDESATFNSLGGDSLTYVGVLLQLEQIIHPLPEDWSERSIGALAALAARDTDTAPARVRPSVPQNLDTLRGLACLMIVALHVVGVAPDEGLGLPEESAWHSVMSMFDMVRLPLFTALAGYLYAALPATMSGYGGFIGRKARQLLVPMAFATLVFWGLRQFVYGLDESLIWAYVRGYLHLWYIQSLFLIFAAVAALDVWVKPKAWGWATALALSPLLFPLLQDVEVFHMSNTAFLLPFFLLGVLLYRAPRLLASSWFLGAAAVLAVLMALWESGLVRADAGDFYRLLLWIGGAAYVVSLLRWFPKFRALELIGGFSFTIYLWHPAANATVRNVAQGLGLEATWPLFIIGMAAGVGVPIIIHLVALRAPRFSLPLIGR